MSEMLWLIRKTLMETFRSKKSWFTYLGLPIAGVLLSLTMYSNAGSGTIHVGIINQDGDQVITQDSIRFIERLNHVEVKVIDEQTMREQIVSGELDSGIVFEPGYAASVREGAPAHLNIVSVKGEQVTAYVKAMLHSYIGNLAAIGKAAQADEAKFTKLYAAYHEQSYKLSTVTLQNNSNVTRMTNQSIGFLIMFMMFSAVDMSEIILKEKGNRTFLRLLSSPMSARSYVFSNIIVSMFILLLQIIVTLLVMKNVFGIDTGVPYSQMILPLFVFALGAIALSLMTVAFAKSRAGVGAISNLIIVPTCLLAGCFFPMEIMPVTVRNISAFLPQHWLLDTVNKLQQGYSLGSLYLNLAILLAFATVFALIAIYRFGRNNDSRQFV
ncbi:ABC transporter permease [Brevibacillus formosus]|uniref:ABC transporter permease n=1 Tax=Brevibacillus TaxID=55080 RepID=UPI000D113A15|nr:MULTISPECIES: ABC transporter permease [Brevibacillus]MBG9943786.1 ABC transporter permease [Brevibacillus formosus]MED1945289.1 ABC transporter permease [Brevibacillus formosus]MED1998588.1 ABC transporter permease [Brevibacillus formosus]MED2083557.1 ABC transporter permease [Brevibacillus formosus]PSK20949.1 ABC transporter permease [Brevibacillus sp. NRRL NRS-603]